jgi:DNA topoisomerase-1
MNLIIVESPTKAKTIKKFLPGTYTIESSYGHVRDLPKGKLGVDVEHNFDPHYVIPRKVQKHVTALKKLAASADTVILATDEDREGEAIAWHLHYALKLDENEQDVKRIAFHEITKSAIERALEHPRDIKVHLVDAQQMRRVLDRLVGYELSPFLWKKVAKGLSAGRVQSVALRLIIEREEEIRAFVPQEYWTITAQFAEREHTDQLFEANLYAIDEKRIDKFDIKTESEAKRIVAELNTNESTVADVEEKRTRKNPLPPFITSTLQQTASHRLGLSAKQTMMIAQKLYERGYITYMRTDSVNLSQEALTGATKWISGMLGEKYTLDKPRYFKNKSKLAQEAHEAIRPTDPTLVPKSMGNEASSFDEREEKVYDLIWRRFIASQLPQAEFDTVRIDIRNGRYTLRANGIAVAFDGFMRIWHTKTEDKILPKLESNTQLHCGSITPEQHFTEPPARYNEASLIKTLEAHGIGRPSTYASIISVIQERNYVIKEQKRFVPTETGELVNKVLVEHFPEIVDIEFTAKMEDTLDAVASGEDTSWQEHVREFYEPFHAKLMEKYEAVQKVVNAEESDEICEKCGKPMLIKFSRYGKFLACSGFPECRNTKSLDDANGKREEKVIMPCPECKEGNVVEKRTRKRRIFYGCSRYPECTYATWDKPDPSSNK